MPLAVPTEMFLYNLTLKPPAFISKVITGSFTGEKRQEFIFLAGNSIIELCTPDLETGKLITLTKQPVFCKIRDILPYRMLGSSKDYIIVAADSGRIVILEYDSHTKTFDRLHQETFGKSGTRRIVPGQYLAVDPRGRATMIAALEKAKLIYILNSDSSKKLTISSPLEANKSNTITCDLVGMDVGYSNPLFAALEIDCSQAPESCPKSVVFYELDLGINHVVRKCSFETPGTSNLLIPLPEGIDGVLVCSEGSIQWINSKWNQEFPSIAIPKASCEDLWTERQNLIISFAIHKSKSSFFVLLLTEDGDLLKLTIDPTSKKMKIVYFDSFPGASLICLSKNGFLFIGGCSKITDALYQVQKLAEDEKYTFDQDSLSFEFKRHEHLQNLELVDKIDATFPLTDAKLIQSSLGMSNTLHVCKGKSELAILKCGISTTQLASSPLPRAANGIWTLKSSLSDQFHSILLISFESSSVLLSIAESISVMQDSIGFILNNPTIECFTLYNNSYIQVISNCFRHIKGIASVQDWKVPSGRTITHASASESNLIIVLDKIEILHFALDSLGNLHEESERKTVPTFIESISIGEGGKFLAVACSDATCRIVSLLPHSWLQMQSMQVFSAIPTCVQLLRMHSTCFLHVSLDNGEYHRIIVDSATGALLEATKRAVASGKFQLRPVSLEKDSMGILLLTESRSILVHSVDGTISFSPLLLPNASSALLCAASISSELCRNALIGIAEETLSIFSCNFNSSSFSIASEVNLKFQPKRIILSNDLIAVIQSEHCVLHRISNSTPTVDEDAMQFSDDEGQQQQNSNSPQITNQISIQKRYIKGFWASTISIFTKETNVLLQEIILADNYVPISACFIEFASHFGEGKFFIVGAAQNFIPNGGTFEKCALFTFKFLPNSSQFQIYHMTEVEALPFALCSFQGMLLVGIGKVLRMFDLGKKKLLRKCESNSAARSQIMSILSKGLRIVIGDALSGAIFLHYKIQENQFIVIADDPIPRPLSCLSFVDWDTVACADKFGNVFLNRIPDSLAENIELDPTCSKLSEKPYLLAAPSKTVSIAQFHLGELVTSLQKGIVSFGGQECIIWTTILGRIGILAPFERKSEYDFFQLLESAMRQEYGSSFGRDHFAHRSNYLPCDNVIDGDLCEMFSKLPAKKKSEISIQLGKSSLEVSNTIANLRAKYE